MLSTARAADSMPQNVARSVACAAGFGTSRRTIFVMMASVPSEPTSSCVRSYPTTFFTVFPPVVTISPVGSTASRPSTYFFVVPYLNARGPPAHSATFPPMLDLSSDAGSGG